MRDADQDLERWLDESVPRDPRPEFDRRLLDQAQEIIAEHAAARPATQPATQPERGYLAAAAAVLAICSIGYWVVARQAVTEQCAERALVIAVPEDTRFELAAGTRYRHADGSICLELLAGKVTAAAARAPLTIAFPGGRLRVERGIAEAQVFTEGVPELQQHESKVQKRATRTGAIMVVLALAGGAAWYEIAGETTTLHEGEERRFLVEPGDGGGSNARVTVTELPGKLPAPADADAQANAAKTGQSKSDPAAGAGAGASAIENVTWRGKIIDAESGEPIAGAQVAWVREWVAGDLPDPRSALPPGVFSLTNEAAQRNLNIAGAPAELARVAASEGIDLGVIPPLAGGEQSLLRGDLEVASDALGNFTLPARAAEDDFLRILTAGRPLMTWMSLPPPGEDGVRVFALPPGQLVQGRLMDESGQPLKGNCTRFGFLQALFDTETKGWVLATGVQLTGDGQFSLLFANAPAVRVKGFLHGYHAFEQEFALTAGLNILDVSLRQHPHIEGRVIDESGAPVAGAAIIVRSYERSFFGGLSETWSGLGSDEDGYFRANIDYEANADLSASKDGHVPKEIRGLKLKDSPFEIVLVRAEKGSLSGVVLDADRQPVAGAAVRADWVGIGISNVGPAITDENGKFLITEVNPGTYKLAARPTVSLPAMSATPREDGSNLPFSASDTGIIHFEAELTGVEVKSGEPTTDLEIVLARGGTIWGIVRDESSQPLVGEQVSLYRPDLLGNDHQFLLGVLADASGRYEVRGVPPGMYAVALERLGTYSLVRVREGESDEINLGGAAGILTGTLTRAGEEMRHASVSIARFEESISGIQFGNSGPEGVFRFDKLSYGRYLVHCRDSESGAAFATLVEVRAPEVKADLEWPRGSIAVSISGDPLPPGSKLTLDLVELGGTLLEGNVPAPYLRMQEAASADGIRFEFKDLARGKYRIATTGERSARAEVDFSGGVREIELVVP